MKLLVIGGAGYIGSVMTAQLLKAGHEPTVLDNLSKGHREATPQDINFIDGTAPVYCLSACLVMYSEVRPL
jgi:UDP-glucose 4-epimerase